MLLENKLCLLTPFIHSLSNANNPLVSKELIILVVSDSYSYSDWLVNWLLANISYWPTLVSEPFYYRAATS